MNKKECKIIQDLLPNYIEKLTTDETNSYVEEHLKECDECPKVLENMQKDIDINNKKADIKEINYIKKISFKMKILKFLILIIVLGVIVFAGSILRKYLILLNFQKLGDSKVPKDNYIKMVYSMNTIQGADGSYVTVNIYKKGNKLIRNTRYMGGYNREVNIYTDEKEVITTVNDNGKNIFAEISKGEQNMWDDKINTINDWYLYAYIKEYDLSFITKLKLLINLKITLVNLNGIDCYLIEENGIRTWVEKETGIILRDEYNGITDYYYGYNCVNDNMFEKPDISTYEKIISKEGDVYEK